ncbi:hypothetical protein WJX74_010849 [Apatococcus lobatus]|uniref:Uncharacterized protein n=1 Tax=Apatococcus lobatus TaxID=904363 RepID=A0AAW1QNI1_9CHLO
MSGQLGDPELEDLVVDHIAKRPKLDDSVDTTGLGVRQRGAVVGREGRLVEKLFGSDAQDAVGERVPDDPPASPMPFDPDAELREIDQHNHGPADARRAEAAQQADTAEEDAAAESARQAERRGGGEDAVLDAMVEAEAAYNARQASAGTPGTSTDQQTSNDPLRSDTSANPSGPPQGKGRASGITDAFRESVRAKLRESLQSSTSLADEVQQQGLDQASRRLENSCLEQGTSRTVYVSRVSNARRLAPAVRTLDDLVKVAKGERLENLNDSTASDSNVSQAAAGKQGISIKPQ